MRKLVLLMLAMLVAAGVTFGADSKTNRAEKTVGITIPLIPIHLETLLTWPIGLQYIHSDHWVFGGEYGSASATIEDGDSKAKLDFSNMGVNTRWFPNTNSFNVGLALNQRTFTGEATVKARDAVTGIEAQVKGAVEANATVATILISNQWTFDFGMTITADWLVLSGAVASSSSATIKSTLGGVAVTPSQTADAEKSLQDVGDLANLIQSAPGIFVISIGWSF